jgi:hypothetical protein
MTRAKTGATSSAAALGNPTNLLNDIAARVGAVPSAEETTSSSVTHLRLDFASN